MTLDIFSLSVEFVESSTWAVAPPTRIDVLLRDEAVRRRADSPSGCKISIFRLFFTNFMFQER